MPTLIQVQEYLASIGITLPDFIVQAMLDDAAAIQPCLDGAGYSASTQLLIYLYLLALGGIVSGDRYISSQTAPSGASQSFRYNSMVDKYRSTLSALRALDKSGCTDSLIPAEPGASAGLWVSKGGCE
jgi:hypothetical protein